MFYGLSNYIKNLLPKRLFYRGLLIVAVPIVVLQVTISLVFFDSLWIKTNAGMTRGLIAEIKTFIDAYDNDQQDKDYIINLFKSNLEIEIQHKEGKVIPDDIPERWFSPLDRSLRRELKSKHFVYWFNTTNYKDLVDIKIQHINGYFQFFVPRSRLTTSSARLFGLWITLPAFLMIAIAIIFLKNQTRPIIKLAEASERFGKGEEVEEFVPSGALEIRQAGYEFEKMRKRILKHLNQRSDMLSGISHDLRTPLTRIKLQLTFIKDKEISKKLSEDVNEMEKMLDEYLQFTKSQFSEKTSKINLNKLIESVTSKYEKNKIKLELLDNVEINGRINLLQRCLENLINNSIKYAKNTYLKLSKSSSNTIVIIEDDGPGIPVNEYENVFKPFYKMNKGRADSKSSVGLGLSIASDIIRSHGGNIKLEKSKMDGLEVKIFLPL